MTPVMACQSNFCTSPAGQQASSQALARIGPSNSGRPVLRSTWARRYSAPGVHFPQTSGTAEGRLLGQLGEDEGKRGDPEVRNRTASRHYDTR